MGPNVMCENETPEERIINDRIEDWHLRYTGPMPLHEFLGWTWEEYKHWVETSETP